MNDTNCWDVRLRQLLSSTLRSVFNFSALKFKFIRLPVYIQGFYFKKKLGKGPGFARNRLQIARFHEQVELHKTGDGDLGIQCYAEAGTWTGGRTFASEIAFLFFSLRFCVSFLPSCFCR